MIPVLLDTNAYSAFRGGNADALAIVQQAPEVGISVVTLCELLSGFASGSRLAQNRAELSSFLESDRVRILSVDAATAELYASIHAQLRRIGKQIPTNDLLIAACAMQHSMAIFTFDNHFTPISGLHVVRTAGDLGSSGQSP